MKCTKTLTVITVLLLILQVVAIAFSLPKHVNPAEVRPEGPSPIELLALYQSIVEAVALENHTEATLRIKDAFEMYAPEDLKYIVSRFNELLDKVVELLNDTDACIAVGRELIMEGFFDEAEIYIDKGYISLAKANVTYGELVDATVELSRRLRISLHGLVGEFEVVIDDYFERLNSLSKLLEDLRGRAAETELHINVNCSEAWVGSTILVFGVLSEVGGGGISHRNVTVYIGGKGYTASTNDDGYFEAFVGVPYIYRVNATVYAVYTPTGDDVGVYAGSKSNEVELKLLYVKPSIRVSLDKVRVKPAERFTIYGNIDPSGLRVWLKVFGVKYDLPVDENGVFNLTITVPGHVGEGNHVVEVGSYAEGIYAPAHKLVKFEVYRLPLKVDVSFPLVAVCGFTVEFSGRVLSDGGAVSGAKVTVEAFGISSSGVTASDGCFSVKLNVPYGVFSGWRELKVYVKPTQPWYRGATLCSRALFINPYTLAFPLILAIVLIRRAWPVKEEVSAPKHVEEPAFTKPPSLIPIKPVGGLPRLYFDAVRLIESRFEVFLRPSDTIREYLLRVEDLLGDALDPFRELSFMLEMAVYGGIEPDVSRAEELFEKFKVLMEGGEG